MRLVLLALLMLWPVMANALTIQEQQLARRNFPPFASGDAAVKLDATLTSSAARVAAGFVEEGTGIVYDSNGFNGKGTGNLRMNAWAGAAAVAPQGTLYIQVERAAVSWSNANNAGYDNLFHDSTGTDSGAERYVFTNYNGAQTNLDQIFYFNGSPDAFRMNVVTGGTSQITDITTFNSHAIPTYQDSRYMTIVLTWQDKTWWWYVDGHLIKTGTASAAKSSTDFDGFRVGSQGTSKRLGDFYIKRIQISTYYCPPVMVPLRVAGYGDSFMLASIEGTVPGADTVAAINTSQIATTMVSPNFGRSRGQASFMHGIRALAWTELGAYFPYYISAKQGTGYEKSATPSAYRDAVNAYRPELLICMQSINDVDASTPATDIVGNTKTMLDAMIDGNPALRKILFITGISGHQDPTKAAIVGWKREYNRLRLLLDAGLSNYRGKVQVIDAYEAWGGDDYSFYQTIGSSPDNAVTAGNDPHPSATGHQKIAEMLWPYMRDFLIARPSKS